MYESVLHNYFSAIRIAFFAFLSYLLNRPISLQSLKIREFSLIPLRAKDIRYEAILYAKTDPYSFKFTCTEIAVHLHRPTPSYPRWLSVAARDLFYTSSTADVSTQCLNASLWVFPKLFKRTSGPWIDADLDGLRLRVFSSHNTPYFIQRLRENVAGSVVAGSILRLDDFWTNMQFAGLTERAPNTTDGFPKENGHTQPTVDASHALAEDDEDDAGGDQEDWRHSKKREAFLEGRNTHGADSDSDLDSEVTEAAEKGIQHDLLMPVFPHQTDELRASALVRGLHIDTHEGRVLSFGRIDAQMRRDWNLNKGSFVMVAEEARWVRVPWVYQMEYTGFWTQLGTSLMQFPLDLVHSICYPMTTINLYVPRTDITFDEFRIRDAEMLKQAFSMLREKSRAINISWTDAFLDFVLYAFL